jgi:PAS domain S-box-containing protein
MALESESYNEDFLLRSISDGTAAETGSSFFRALVKNLSRLLGTYGAWVTEYLPDAHRLKALAFWLGDGYVEHYEYDVKGTPCEKSLREKTFLHVPENVIDLFPGDPDLPQMGAVSYMGFPLLDSENTILGNLAVLDTRPIPDSFRNLAVFRIFAARATAELLRLRAEAGLRDREEKLRSLFDGTMDAIVELDRNLQITMTNPSARRLFALAEEPAPGASFKPFLIEEDATRLVELVKRLEKGSRFESSLWIPNGLTALAADGEPIRTEATLSQIENRGAPFFVLILRDVNERIEAERKIASLREETRYLRDEIRALSDRGKMIGRSNTFQKTLQRVAEVAPTDSTVLIYGETGTGKELIARAIHAAGSRKERPLITVNCAAIPATLLESEFFGHEKGAFTGATQRREGRFSLADGGTIFLDEVGELPLEMQAKLLRVLQEGELSPVGSARIRKVDVRVIAATNRDLSRAVREGTFRTDLYYRLNVFPITVPPLRDRGDDIGLLAAHFVETCASRLGRRIDPLTTDLEDRLNHYDWPGNVRELQNVIERAVITARHGRLNLELGLPRPIESEERRTPHPSTIDRETILTEPQLRRFEKENLVRALQKSQWRVAGPNGAAKLLGMPPSTLQSRMKALGIKRPRD